jgi:uncharacterized protein (DUF433 family)
MRLSASCNNETNALGETKMQLEDFFDFDRVEVEPFGLVENIRVKGTRIGIEFIIGPFLKGDSPERIFHGYRHSLSLEQVYGTITYYLHNKTKVDEYLRRGDDVCAYFYREYLKNEPSDVLLRLRALKAQRQTTPQS